MIKTFLKWAAIAMTAGLAWPFAIALAGGLAYIVLSALFIALRFATE